MPGSTGVDVFNGRGCAKPGSEPLFLSALARKWNLKPEVLAPPPSYSQQAHSADPRCATVSRLQMAAEQRPSDALHGNLWAVAQLHDKCLVRPRPNWIFLAVGAIAGIIGGVGIIAQMVTIIRQQSACDVSIVYLGLTLFASCLWLAYGIGLNLVVQRLTGVAGILIVGIIIGLKAHYDKDPTCWKS